MLPRQIQVPEIGFGPSCFKPRPRRPFVIPQSLERSRGVFASSGRIAKLGECVKRANEQEICLSARSGVRGLSRQLSHG